jgi:hypothetical protein
MDDTKYQNWRLAGSDQVQALSSSPHMGTFLLSHNHAVSSTPHKIQTPCCMILKNMTCHQELTVAGISLHTHSPQQQRTRCRSHLHGLQQQQSNSYPADSNQNWATTNTAESSTTTDHPQTKCTRIEAHRTSIVHRQSGGDKT